MANATNGIKTSGSAAPAIQILTTLVGVACTFAVVASAFGTSGTAGIVLGACAGAGLATWAVLAGLDRRSAPREESALPPLTSTGTTHDGQAHRLITKATREFRTPLTGISGMSQIIEHDAAAPGHVRQFAAVITAAAADLTRMVEDLLATAQLDAENMRLVLEDLDAEYETHLAVKPYSRGLSELTVSCEPSGIRADRSALRQILRNIVSNAVRHGDGIVHITGDADGSAYRWTVRDNGSGLPQTHGERAFDDLDLRWTEASDGGLGLGLSVARRLARALGGDVRYSRDRGYTDFVVEIPLAAASVQREPV